MSELYEDYERGLAAASTSPADAAARFKTVVTSDLKDDLSLTLKEKSVYELVKVLCNSAAHDELLNIFEDTLPPYFKSISKAKSGKIVRSVIDRATDALGSAKRSIAIDLTKVAIEWCGTARKFLKLQLESVLSVLYLEDGDLQVALTTVTDLVRAIKKVDDKHVLVDVHLIESRVQHALHNIPKAKAALTSARAAASSIYVGPKVLAAMDQQSGQIAMEERDYKTSFSYFFEAFEGFDSLERGDKPDERARSALKYMLLSKIMNDNAKECEGVCMHKLALKYGTDLEIECMKMVASAYSKRSLSEYESVINNEKYKAVIHGDSVVQSKLTELSDMLIEQNLTKLIEAYSRVEVEHIAKLIALDVDVVSRKLSQMILDNKFNGILDQGTGSIIVFDDESADKSYDYALETIDTLGHTVDKLFEKAKLLD
jgi:26S proteasome regulatory subunit N6